MTADTEPLRAVRRGWFGSPASVLRGLAASTTSRRSVVDMLRVGWLYPVMPRTEPLTRRRAVDLVRVAAALCRFPG